MVFDFLTKRSIMTRNTLRGMTDVHAHLLPGVDDGVQSVEDAVRILERLHEAGISRVFCTPHVMADLYGNRKALLQERFDEFVSGLPPVGIEIFLAAEYMLDNGFLSHLKDGLLTFDGRHVLVETSYMSAPPAFEDLLYEIDLSGYCPVLAHPERYLYMGWKQYEMLWRRGCLFQLNLLSLGGYYGKEVCRKAEWLLEMGYYHFVGTDIHKGSQANFFSSVKTNRKTDRLLRKLVENNEMK